MVKNTGCNKHATHELGAVFLEYALTLPIFLGIIFVSADLIRVLYQSVSLEYSVATASRWAILGNTMPDPLDPTTSLERLDSVKLVVREAAQKLGVTLTNQEIRLCRATNANCVTESVGDPDERMLLTVTKPTRMVIGMLINLKSSVIFRNEL